MFALRRSSAMCSWVALELNILRFLPIMTSERLELSLENSLKYFLVQRIGSILFLTRVLMLEGATYSVFPALLTLSMLLKLGVAPLHGWFISLIGAVSMRTLLYLSTVQKIIPLIILSRLVVGGPLLWAVLLATLAAAFSRGYSNLPLRKILGVSSLNNLVWLVLASQIRLKLLRIVFSIYRFLLASVVKAYNRFGRDLNFRLGAKTYAERCCTIFSLMSLGGMPPFLGFLGKALVLKEALGRVRIAFLLILVINSLMILMYYLNIVISATLVTPSVKLSAHSPSHTAGLHLQSLSILLFNALALTLLFNWSFEKHAIVNGGRKHISS